MTTVVLNSNEYSADGTGDRDMLNGGHRTWFIPCLSDTLVEVADAATSASDSAASAVLAANYAAALSGTSATSTTVGTGSKSFTASTGKQWQVGQYVYVARTSAPTTYMAGQVTAYNSGTGALTVDVQSTNGSGTYTDWTITIGGAKGATGSINLKTTADKSGVYTLVSGDLGTMIRCTGTWTLSVTAAATLGAGWWCYVVNEGTGTVTIDPDSTETVRGATTLALYGGEGVLLTCKSTSSDHFEVHFVTAHGLASLGVATADAAALVPFAGYELMEHETTNGPGTASSQPFVHYANSTWFAIQSGSTTLWTSGDGATWTSRTAAANTYAAASGFAWNANDYVILHNGSTAACSFSGDSGATWASKTLPATTSWVGVAWIAGSVNKFVAVASATTNAATSADGETWASSTKGLSATCNGIVANTTCAIATYSTGTSYEKFDGTSWSTQTIPGGYSVASIAGVANGTFFINVGTQGQFAFYSGTDGVSANWTRRTMPPNCDTVTRVFYLAGVYFVLAQVKVIAAGTISYQWFATTDFANYTFLGFASYGATATGWSAIGGNRIRHSDPGSSFAGTMRTKDLTTLKRWYTR